MSEALLGAEGGMANHKKIWFGHHGAYRLMAKKDIHKITT